MYYLEYWNGCGWDIHSEHRSPSAAFKAFLTEQAEQHRILDRSNWMITSDTNASWACAEIVATSKGIH